MIFDKSGTGEDEVKGLLGFVQASIAFENYKTYISLAERDIKKIISKEVFKVAEDHYLSAYETADSGSGSGSEPTNELLDELVHKIQLPVALYAYLPYATSNDLTHSDKGRLMMTSEFEKHPFEWMIRRDDDNITSLAHKAMDVLIEFLDEHVAYFPEWKNSDAYTESKKLCINTAEVFDGIFPIESSRRLFIILIPMIKDVERKWVKPILGATDYDALKAAIIADNLTTDQQELLEYIKTPLALLTMSVAVRRLSAKVMPSGIFQEYIPESVSTNPKNTAASDVRNGLAVSLEKDALVEIKRLQDYISVKDDAEYTPPDPTTRHSETNKFFRA